MVLLKELKKNMFWGVSLDGGKRYTQVVETSFHISMAALEQSSVEIPKGKRSVSLWIQHEKAEFLLCTLDHGRVMQQTLDLNFTEGEEITLFSTGGNGSIHLSGYLMDEPDMDNEMTEMSEEDMSSEEEDSEAEVPQLLPLDDSSIHPGKKRKNLQVDTFKKKQKVIEADFDSDDDDEEDVDYTLEDEVDENMFEEASDDDVSDLDEFEEDGEEDGDDDDEEDDDDDGEEDDDADEVVKVILEKHKKKTPNKSTGNKTLNKSTENKTPKNKTPNVNGTPTESESSKKKKKKKNKDNNTTINTPSPSVKKIKEETPQKSDTPKKRVLADGLVVEDIKVGNGPPAKSDKMVHMYYVGRFSSGKQFDSCSSGKQFDSCSSGKPFKFRLGKREVIKGWDIGVQGMKVGGKRRLIVPPKLGYGNQKQGPIPGNSTLVFDVELKAVS